MIDPKIKERMDFWKTFIYTTDERLTGKGGLAHRADATKNRWISELIAVNQMWNRIATAELKILQARYGH